jgi:hypothetical protein
VKSPFPAASDYFIIIKFEFTDGEFYHDSPKFTPKQFNVQQLNLKNDVPFLPMKFLKAGNLSCYYEAGNLRYIKWGSTELIRMIYSAVRAENWDTVRMSISNEEVKETDHGFTITYKAAYRQGLINYHADINIEGHNNSISFTMIGEALSSFKKNRIGLCVLHPLKACMERPVQILQPDGSSASYHFPKLISPHQPFKNIREMQWQTRRGISTTLRFEGDIFETEDQRNWTDASYKTYSTPLEIPFPALVDKGSALHQAITLTAAGSETVSTDEQQLVEEQIKFPAVGFSREKGSSLLTDKAVLLLNEIPFSHYAVTLKLSEEGWKRELELAAGEAEMLKARLQLVCSCDHTFETQIEELVQSLKEVRDVIGSVLLVDCKHRVTSAPIADYGFQKLKAEFPQLSVCYGTDGNFAELNRNQPGGSSYDSLHFSLYPQAHASDNRTIIENLESHWHNIATVKSFSNGAQVHVSVSFQDPNGTLADDRQQTLFAAYWQLMCLQGLAEVDKITFHSAVGKAGLLTGDLHKSSFYELLKVIKDFRPEKVIRRFQNGFLSQDGLMLENSSGERLWIRMPEIQDQ